MTEARELPPSWINKGTNDIPAWLAAHMVGKRREPNASLLIWTQVGKDRVQARCLLGYMVFERKGVAYTRHPSEARSFIADLEEAERVSASPAGPTPSPPAAPRQPAPRPAKRTAPAATPAKRRFAAPLGMPPSIENRHPSELKIDDSYQRSIDTGPSRALISKIAHNWDWRMLMPLVVSKRDDGLYVIDGQHRQAAAMMRGDIPFLPCCVAVYENVAAEAAMFVAMNRARRAVNRLDDFHAAQAGGDEDARAIAALIEAAGFTVSRRTGSASWAPGEVAFTSAIGSIRRKHGEAIARDALRMMAEAFPDERLVAGSSIFTAICKVLVSPPADFDRARLFQALLKFDMRGWADFLAGAKGGDDRAAKLREVLLLAYDEAAPTSEVTA